MTRKRDIGQEILDGIREIKEGEGKIRTLRLPLKSIIFLSYMGSLRRSNSDGEWISKTTREIFHETTLNAYQQKEARKPLKSLGVLEERYHRWPLRLLYRINMKRLSELADQLVSEDAHWLQIIKEREHEEGVKVNIEDL